MLYYRILQNPLAAKFGICICYKAERGRESGWRGDDGKAVGFSTDRNLNISKRKGKISQQLHS